MQILWPVLPVFSPGIRSARPLAPSLWGRRKSRQQGLNSALRGICAGRNPASSRLRVEPDKALEKRHGGRPGANPNPVKATGVADGEQHSRSFLLPLSPHPA